MIFSVIHCNSQSMFSSILILQQSTFFFFLSAVFLFPYSLSLFVFIIIPLRRTVSHVSQVTTVMLRGSRHLQENAGKVSSALGVQSVLNLL